METRKAQFDPSQIGKPKPPAEKDPNEKYLGDFDQRWNSELSRLYQQGKIGEEVVLAGLVHLAAAKPQHRAALLPLIQRAAVTVQARRIAAVRQVMAHQRVEASAQKVAHKPTLAPQGLDRQAVMAGMGTMQYNIDAEANHSKFYEQLIVEAGGRYVLMQRWGALTDSGSTGRIDRKDTPCASLGEARGKMDKKYREKIAHGYTDAFGPRHQGAPGEYPIGLTRKGPGFGWGTQSITKCIPSLKFIVAALEAAKAEANADARSDMIETSLQVALRNIERLAHEDSSMAQTLKDKIRTALARIQNAPPFLADAQSRWVISTVDPLIRYIQQQTSYCG